MEAIVGMSPLEDMRKLKPSGRTEGERYKLKERLACLLVCMSISEDIQLNSRLQIREWEIILLLFALSASVNTHAFAKCETQKVKQTTLPRSDILDIQRLKIGYLRHFLHLSLSLEKIYPCKISNIYPTHKVR